MSIKKSGSNLENRIKNIMPITITTNINSNNYVFVNKKNQISSLYLKMGEKINSRKLKNTKSCSNLQNSEDSKNDISNNSFKILNFSTLKNLRTNNNISELNEILGNNIIKNQQKLPDKQDYLIHVNLNRNKTSLISNLILNKKNRKNKFSQNKNKTIISLNNSELYNSLKCLSSRNKLYPKNKEKSNLKKNKNNMKTKKFKFPFNERKKNKYISTSFCNLNITNNININQTLQKSETRIINNNSTKNYITSRINKERKAQHARFNTMFIDEKNINEKIIKKNNLLKQKINSNKNFKHNNSVLSIYNKEKIQKLNEDLFKAKNNQNTNSHIKNSLSTYGNSICVDNKEKNGISKKDKNIINKNKNKKNLNPIIERKVKINRKELLQDIKNKIDNKKKLNEIKSKPQKIENKFKEFSKIIVLDDYKSKKTSFNKLNQNTKTNYFEYLNKTKREDIKNKNNLILNNSKAKDGLEIVKIKSFKTIKNKNNGINNDSLDKKKTYNDNIIKDINIVDFSSEHDERSFPFHLINQKKPNYKKPLIKITTHSNISFNNKKYDKEPSNSAVNNSQLMTINQNNLFFKDKKLIIKKKKIGNNSFHINKKLICYSSRPLNNNKNIEIQNLEIKNTLFDNENLEDLPDNDDQFNDLYAVVRKINFVSILIGAESLFSLDSRKYKEFQYNFDLDFIKKFNKSNIDNNKAKNVKKINNSCSTKTDFSSSNKNFYKNIYNYPIIPNEFEISELI